MALSERKRAYHREYMRKRYQTDPEHRRKQKIRVKTAKLKDKAVACSTCGSPDPEGHHPDYSQPDLLVWLCRDCHLAEHEQH